LFVQLLSFESVCLPTFAPTPGPCIPAVAGGELGGVFLEPLPTGAVQTTTIAHAGAALHSRHSLLPNGGIVPARYQGFCVAG
jgi:hypothetical protein